MKVVFRFVTDLYKEKIDFNKSIDKFDKFLRLSVIIDCINISSKCVEFDSNYENIIKVSYITNNKDIDFIIMNIIRDICINNYHIMNDINDLFMRIHSIKIEKE